MRTGPKRTGLWGHLAKCDRTFYRQRIVSTTLQTSEMYALYINNIIQKYEVGHLEHGEVMHLTFGRHFSMWWTTQHSLSNPKHRHRKRGDMKTFCPPHFQVFTTLHASQKSPKLPPLLMFWQQREMYHMFLVRWKTISTSMCQWPMAQLSGVFEVLVIWKPASDLQEKRLNNLLFCTSTKTWLRTLT